MTEQPSRLSEESDGADPTWDRLEDQLAWYDRKSVAAQQAYNRIKLAQLAVGATVPVVAALQAPAAVTAILAAVVVVAEGVQQLYQWQTTWVLYRATAEALKHEKFLYLAAAGPYGTVDRLLHHAHVCQTTGDSVRLSQALAGGGVVPLGSPR